MRFEDRMAAPTLLFDLDGTLVHSVPDLCAALNRLAAARGMAAFTEDETARMVGDGVHMLVERAFAARGRMTDPAAVASFLADYTLHCAEQTRLYPGAHETLERLHAVGWRLAVCTNKPEAAARRLLDALGVAAFFSGVGAGDSFPYRKPDPRHLLSTIEAAGGVPSRAVMIGDHRNDVAGAHAAGLPCIFAAWGYGAPGMEDGADAVAQHFADVPRLADSVLTRTGT